MPEPVPPPLPPPVSSREPRAAARRPVAILLTAWSSFAAAQWLFAIAAGVFAFEASGTTGVGLVTAARLLPAVVAAPLAGLAVDRWDRSRVVVVSCGVYTAGAAAAAAAVWAGSTLGALVLATVVVGAAGASPRPALQSLLPLLADSPGALTRATAVWSAADSVGFLVGAGGGGLLTTITDPAVALGVAAALGLLTMVLAVRLPHAGSSHDAPKDTALFAGVLAGAGTVVRTRLLHAPMALFIGLLVLEGASDVLLVALALGNLHLAGGPGLLYLLWGAGGLLGSVALVWVVRVAGYGRALLVGAVLFGALLAVSGTAGAVVAAAAMVPVGVGYSLVESAVMGIIPRLADHAVMGRVYGLCELLHAGVASLGALLAPVLVDLVGVVAALGAVGAGYCLCAGVVVRRCVALDRGEQISGRVRDLLHGVPFLTPLPLPQLERLVRAAQAVTVRAGDAVVVAGAPGDRFFVIDRGEVEIVEYGRRQGVGEGFGEIALLHDVPRTATVRAIDDVSLWAVERTDFLAAVGGDAEVRVAATRVVEQHLGRPRVAPLPPTTRGPD